MSAKADSINAEILRKRHIQRALRIEDVTDEIKFIGAIEAGEQYPIFMEMLNKPEVKI